jgi:aspartyl-tRNA(Asn)/glutamyl-tRNA(Gln) amidotransferase subunit A
LVQILTFDHFTSYVRHWLFAATQSIYVGRCGVERIGVSTTVSKLSLVELIEQFRNGVTSPVEVAKASLDQAERKKGLNVFVASAEPEAVLAQAHAAEERWHRGSPLGLMDGVPITVKDTIITKEWPTLAGSRTVDPARSLREDAPAVARLREDGAIILGKTTTPEFGWKAVTDSPLTGITRNPWNPDVTPGGSSGGSAAALAAGIGHAAIGTDAAGSVRIPGAFCGLVALKATRGRIPAYPPSSLWALGHIGPICRCVADTALMLSIMARPDARDWNAAPPDPTLADWSNLDVSMTGMRIAYSPTFGYGKIQNEVKASVEAAAHVFSDLGADVEFVSAPFKDPTPQFRVLFAAGISHALRNLTPPQRALLDPGLQKLIACGETIDRRSFMEATEAAMTLGREMRLFHETYQLLISPTVAVAPFTAGALSPQGYDPSDWFDWSPFAHPFNMTGQPAVTVPCGLTKDGLPIGLQLVSAPYTEKLLLSAARAFEQSCPNPVGQAIA